MFRSSSAHFCDQIRNLWFLFGPPFLTSKLLLLGYFFFSHSGICKKIVPTNFQNKLISTSLEPIPRVPITSRPQGRFFLPSYFIRHTIYDPTINDPSGSGTPKVGGGVGVLYPPNISFWVWLCVKMTKCIPTDIHLLVFFCWPGGIFFPGGGVVFCFLQAHGRLC